MSEDKQDDKQDDKPNKEAESWLQKKWRPMMAMMYMCVCASDFILFPIMFTIVQFWEVLPQNDAFRQWLPLTLQGGGLFHMAMGAVLGITAWSRGQEKIAGVAAPPMATTMTTTTQTQQVSYGRTQQPGFDTGYGAMNTNYGSPGPVTGYGGKMAPPQPSYPLL